MTGFFAFFFCPNGASVLAALGLWAGKRNSVVLLVMRAGSSLDAVFIWRPGVVFPVADPNGESLAAAGLVVADDGRRLDICALGVDVDGSVCFVTSLL